MALRSLGKLVESKVLCPYRREDGDAIHFVADHWWSGGPEARSAGGVRHARGHNVLHTGRVGA